VSQGQLGGSGNWGGRRD